MIYDGMHTLPVFMADICKVAQLEHPVLYSKLFRGRIFEFNLFALEQIS